MTAPLPPNLESTKWIDLQRVELTPIIATQLLEPLHWSESDPKNIGRRQVYLARGSRPIEAAIGARVARRLGDFGLRTDQDRFKESRIKAIITGCSALVAVVSHRGEGRTSPYIAREISLAGQVGVPVLAIVEEGVNTDDLTSAGVLVRTVGPFTDDIALLLDDILQNFVDDVGDPPCAAYGFFGHTFDGAEAKIWSCIRRCVQAVGGIPCISGDEILGGDVQQQIVRRIRTLRWLRRDRGTGRLRSRAAWDRR